MQRKKFIAIAVVFLFIYQSVYSLPAGNPTISQFEKAKEEYLNKDYQSAKERLKRLIYVLDKKRVKIILLARIYLLLAASCEKTNKLKDAKKFYKKSMGLWRKVPDGGKQTDNRKIVKEKNVPYIFECNFNDLKYYQKYIVSYR